MENRQAILEHLFERANVKNRQALREHLAAAAELLRQEEAFTFFPGWVFEHATTGESALYHRIRNVAWAIHGNTHYDGGVNVLLSDVGELVQYLACLFEE